MNLSNNQHLRQIYAANIKRLRVLELQQALKGINTPPEVVIEIDEIRNKILEIEKELSSDKEKSGVLDRNSSEIDLSSDHSRQKVYLKPNKRHKNKNRSKRTVEIILKGEFHMVTPEVRNAIRRAVAALVDIADEHVEILNVIIGSIKILISLDEEAAEYLVFLLKGDTPLLKGVDIESVSLIESKEHTSLIKIGVERVFSRELWLRMYNIILDLARYFVSPVSVILSLIIPALILVTYGDAISMLMFALSIIGVLLLLSSLRESIDIAIACYCYMITPNHLRLFSLFIYLLIIFVMIFYFVFERVR